MRLFDVTLPISSDLPVWPGDPSVSFMVTKSLSAGASCNVTQIQIGAHTGTHIDAPYHFLEDGAKVDAIPLETFIGPCLVVEPDSDLIIEKKDILQFDLSRHLRILFKTRNSTQWANTIRCFDKNYVALSLEAAQYLVERQTILIGIDALSIESFESTDNAVHKLLLSNNITILEGLDLSGVQAGTYELVCLPLKLQGCEGAPARVLLREVS